MFDNISKYSSPNQRSCRFCPIENNVSRSFPFLISFYEQFWVNSWIRCEVEVEIFFFFCVWASNNSSTICYKPFSIKLRLHFCQISVDYICVYLFVGSLFCSTDIYVYPLPIPHSLEYCSFIVSVEIP